ncbi:MAG: alpha/beta fold hydrolase [Nocardioides sp.]|nr:alpha/beta fold hydrolase [Nocardioides sp.]
MGQAIRVVDVTARGGRERQDPVTPAVPALDVRELTVDGAVIRVGMAGAGPPLLLINGIGANLDMWRPLLAHLPDRRVVVFDVPGTGGSPALSSAPRMGGFADLVVGLLDALGLEQADVLGYSWGGALAQELAHRSRARVRSLVLCATIPGLGGQPPAPWVLGAMGTPLRYYSRTYLRLVAPLVYGVRIQPEVGHLSARRERPPTLRGYAHQMYAIAGWSSRPWLRQLRLPTLVLSGRGDQLATARNGVILAREIRGAVLQVVPGGHLFLLQEPRVAAQAVRRFLADVDAGRGPFQGGDLAPPQAGAGA